MAETAAHLTDHVFPAQPVRQWVLSVPKRLRYFLRQDLRPETVLVRVSVRPLSIMIQKPRRAVSVPECPDRQTLAVWSRF